jgi:hypothetical protein
MIRYEHGILVRRLPEEVFAFLMQAEYGYKWRVSLREVTVNPPGTLKPGVRYIEKAHALGKVIEQELVVISCNPPRQFIAQTLPGKPFFRICYDLEPIDSATQLKITLESHFDETQKMLEPVMRSLYTKEVSADFARLKQCLEMLEQRQTI